MDPQVRALVEQAVGRSCLLLDEERFDDWLASCEPEFHYRIEAYSNEIRKLVTWLDVDRDGMAKLFRTLSMHERDPAIYFRHPSLLSATNGTTDTEAESVTSVMMTRTSLTGITEPFAVARYHDRFVIRAGQAFLLSRRVHMITRVFTSDAAGSHLPI
jgi:hypothetical protein